MINSLRPNNTLISSTEDLEYDTESSSSEEDSSDDLEDIPIHSPIKRDHNFEGFNEVSDNFDAVIALLQKNYDVIYDKHNPRFYMNILKLEIVPEVDLMLVNLNLELDYKNLAQIRSKIKFDKDFVYDEDKVDKFKKLILKRDGFLNDEINYFTIKNDKLSRGTKCVMLRNSRIIVFGRNVNLEYSVIQRILSAGVLLLIGKITREELAVYIRNKLPNGQYELSIKYEPNKLVLIGIEKPVFSF
jgi:hypothetical protein